MAETWGGQGAPLIVPANLLDSVGGDPTTERRDWIAQLPMIVQDVARRWSLRVGGTVGDRRLKEVRITRLDPQRNSLDPSFTPLLGERE